MSNLQLKTKSSPKDKSSGSKRIKLSELLKQEQRTSLLQQLPYNCGYMFVVKICSIILIGSKKLGL